MSIKRSLDFLPTWPMSPAISDHQVARSFWGNRSRPLCSELSELWDSQSIFSFSLCLPLCVSHCSLYSEMEVICGQELRMDNQEAAIHPEQLSLRLSSGPLCRLHAALPYYPALSVLIFHDSLIQRNLIEFFFMNKNSKGVLCQRFQPLGLIFY